MKHVWIIEDTPEGVVVLMHAEANGVQDHFADSLSTHLAAFFSQHIEQLNRLAPVLRVQMEDV